MVLSIFYGVPRKCKISTGKFFISCSRHKVVCKPAYVGVEMMSHVAYVGVEMMSHVAYVGVEMMSHVQKHNSVRKVAYLSV